MYIEWVYKKRAIQLDHQIRTKQRVLEITTVECEPIPCFELCEAFEFEDYDITTNRICSRKHVSISRLILRNLLQIQANRV